jgi:hypothetical protein
MRQEYGVSELGVFVRQRLSAALCAAAERSFSRENINNVTKNADEVTLRLIENLAYNGRLRKNENDKWSEIALSNQELEVFAFYTISDYLKEQGTSTENNQENIV